MNAPATLYATNDKALAAFGRIEDKTTQLPGRKYYRTLEICCMIHMLLLVGFGTNSMQ